ncbi:MAG: 50S ribosomal protein L27 [bacterium]|nr:50S ribosomal protein L27 [bacterium]
MATKKSAGTTKNGRDSNPRYLGIKLYAGETAKIGSIIVRQEGLNTLAGKNTALGRDYTIYSTKAGVVRNSIKRKIGFNNKTKVKNVVNVE